MILLIVSATMIVGLAGSGGDLSQAVRYKSHSERQCMDMCSSEVHHAASQAHGIHCFVIGHLLVHAGPPALRCFASLLSALVVVHLQVHIDVGGGAQPNISMH